MVYQQQGLSVEDQLGMTFGGREGDAPAPAPDPSAPQREEMA